MATAIKVVGLGVKPACLVFSKEGIIKWHVKGPDIPAYLRLRPKLHKSTLGFDLIQASPSSKNGPESVDLDSWFENDECEGHVVTESSVVTMQDCIVTILWWKDEAFLMEEDDLS